MDLFGSYDRPDLAEVSCDLPVEDCKVELILVNDFQYDRLFNFSVVLHEEKHEFHVLC